MKSLLYALLLAAGTLTTIAAVLVWLDREEAPELARRDAGLRLPATAPALMGGAGGVEALIKPWYDLEIRQRFAERALAARLGLAGGPWSLFEVVVVNGGEQPIRVDASQVVLGGEGGEVIAARRLRDLATDQGPASRTLLAVWDQDGRAAVEPGSLRRFLVAVPAGTDLATLTGAQVGPIALVPARVHPEAFERFMDRPHRQMLASVTEQGDGSGRPGGPGQAAPGGGLQLTERER